MDSEEKPGMALVNERVDNGITEPIEGPVMDLLKEDEKMDENIDISQVTGDFENSLNVDGLNPSETDVETISTVPETKSSNPPKKLGVAGGDALKYGTSKTPKDQKGNHKGAVVHNKKSSLSQSLSFPSRGVVAKANSLKKSVDGKSTKVDNEGNGADSKPSVYARLSHPTRRVSTGVTSVEPKRTAEGAATRRATLGTVPNVRQSVSKKCGSVKASGDNSSSSVSQSHDQGNSRLLLPTKDDEDGRSVASSTTPRGSRRSSGSGFAFRLDERAEKRKEFYSKIEEKIHAKEVERNNMQAKSKESQEAAIRQLRKNLTFKATPMPTFYKEPPPPKTELKKIPATRPISPKFGRHKTSSGAPEGSTDGTVSSQSAVCSSSANPSKPTGKGTQVNSNGDSVSLRKSFGRSLSKLPSQKSAAAKTEVKPSNSKPKIRDPELETKKTKDGATESLDKSVEIPSQEINSSEPETDKDAIVNAEASIDSSDHVIQSGEVVVVDN